MKGDCCMAKAKDCVARIFVGTWLLVTLSACETSKHAEIMSTEDLPTQTQISTETKQVPVIESDQDGIPLGRQSISQESLALIPESPPSPPPSPKFPAGDEAEMPSVELDSEARTIAPSARQMPVLPEERLEFPRGSRSPASDYVPEPPPQAFPDKGVKEFVETDVPVQEPGGDSMTQLSPSEFVPDSEARIIAPSARQMPVLPEERLEFPRGSRSPASDYVPEPPPQAFPDKGVKEFVETDVPVQEPGGDSMTQLSPSEFVPDSEARIIAPSARQMPVLPEERLEFPRGSRSPASDYVPEPPPQAFPDKGVKEFVETDVPVQEPGGDSMTQLSPSEFVPDVPAQARDGEAQGAQARDGEAQGAQARDGEAQGAQARDGEAQAGASLNHVKDSGLADVFFDFDQYTIRSDAVAVLEKNAELLKNTHENSSVLIEGHCDERGTEDYNLELGKRRAQAVKAYLIDLGIQETRIQIVSYGKEKPFCTESEPSCWQRNRRGHFVSQ